MARNGDLFGYTEAEKRAYLERRAAEQAGAQARPNVRTPNWSVPDLETSKVYAGVDDANNASKFTKEGSAYRWTGSNNAAQASGLPPQAPHTPNNYKPFNIQGTAGPNTAEAARQELLDRLKNSPTGPKTKAASAFQQGVNAVGKVRVSDYIPKIPEGARRIAGGTVAAGAIYAPLAAIEETYKTPTSDYFRRNSGLLEQIGAEEGTVYGDLAARSIGGLQNVGEKFGNFVSFGAWDPSKTFSDGFADKQNVAAGLRPLSEEEQQKYVDKYQAQRFGEGGSTDEGVARYIDEINKNGGFRNPQNKAMLDAVQAAAGPNAVIDVDENGNLQFVDRRTAALEAAVAAKKAANAPAPAAENPKESVQDVMARLRSGYGNSGRDSELQRIDDAIAEAEHAAAYDPNAENIAWRVQNRNARRSIKNLYSLRENYMTNQTSRMNNQNQVNATLLNGELNRDVMREGNALDYGAAVARNQIAAAGQQRLIDKDTRESIKGQRERNMAILERAAMEDNGDGEFVVNPVKLQNLQRQFQVGGADLGEYDEGSIHKGLQIYDQGLRAQSNAPDLPDRIKSWFGQKPISTNPDVLRDLSGGITPIDDTTFTGQKRWQTKSGTMYLDDDLRNIHTNIFGAGKTRDMSSEEIVQDLIEAGMIDG